VTDPTDPATPTANVDRTDERTAGRKRGCPRLVTVCGCPGVGKSTVSRIAADRLDARWLRTDEIRKDLFSDPEYTDEETRAVYAELLSQAERFLGSGRSLVLDGTFYSRSLRDPPQRLARRSDADYTLIRVRCDPSVVKERIRTREDVSDADVEVYRAFREIFEPVEREHVTIDNSGDLDDTGWQVVDEL
jgi:predicted kinase